LIGMGGLGYLIVNIGIVQRFPTATITGVVIVVLISTAVDLGLQAVQRRLTPWAKAREEV
jgi:ABC-type proline/glycine betaine transport system permease subunit